MCGAAKRDLPQNSVGFSPPRDNSPCWCGPEVHLRCYQDQVRLQRNQQILCCWPQAGVFRSLVSLRQMLQQQSSPRCAANLHLRVVFRAEKRRRGVCRCSDHALSSCCFLLSSKRLPQFYRDKEDSWVWVYSAGGQRSSGCDRNGSVQWFYGVLFRKKTKKQKNSFLKYGRWTNV